MPRDDTRRADSESSTTTAPAPDLHSASATRQSPHRNKTAPLAITSLEARPLGALSGEAVDVLSARHATRGRAECVEPDEAELVARAQRDPRAFAALYACYVDAVYRYCYRRLGNRPDAEDATSAIFVRALTSLPQYQVGTFCGWLFTIAHHVVTDSFRRARPIRPLTTADDWVDPDPGPDDLALAAQERSMLGTLLSQLPADQRDVMELRLSGLRSAEVAGIMGRSPQAVRSLQHRAVTRLRELMDAAAESKEERRGWN